MPVVPSTQHRYPPGREQRSSPVGEQKNEGKERYVLWLDNTTDMPTRRRNEARSLAGGHKATKGDIRRTHDINDTKEIWIKEKSRTASEQ